MGSRSGWSLRALLRGIACLFCIGLLLSVALESSGGGTKATPAPLAAAAEEGSSTNLEGSSSRGRTNGHSSLDPFIATKRRVPNGPDPIHNRRAGKSGRPPGRA